MFSAPGLQIFPGGRLQIEVDHSSFVDVKTQAQQRVAWAFPRANPVQRALILDAVAKDQTFGIDADALRAALRLTEAQRAVLDSEYADRTHNPLRALMREEAPQSSPQQLEQALLHAVAKPGQYMSIRDVCDLIQIVAPHMQQRTRGELNLNDEKERLYRRLMTHLQMGGRTSENDPFLNRRIGPIENFVANGLENREKHRVLLPDDALHPFLRSAARQLEHHLDMAQRVEGADRAWMNVPSLIRESYEQLLVHSLALGEDWRQVLHDACQHLVSAALEQLGAPGPVVGAPTLEHLEQIGHSSALRLKPEKIADLKARFAANPLRRMYAEQGPGMWSAQAMEEALIRQVRKDAAVLSNWDVWALLEYAATEIFLRYPQRPRNDVMVVLCERTIRASNGIIDKQWLSDAKSGIKMPGSIENYMAGIASQFDMVPLNRALLFAPVRCLDGMLDHLESLAKEHPDLALNIQDTFGRLLTESFALGEDALHRVYGALWPRVRAALDWLGHQHLPVLTTPASEPSQPIGPIGRQSNSRKRRKEELTGAGFDAPSHSERAEAMHAVTEARARLGPERERQDRNCCVAHAYNNAWYQWIWQVRPNAPFVRLVLPDAEATPGQELQRILKMTAPDGNVMNAMRLTREQCSALMPELTEHLDLAIVYHGNVADEQFLGHFTSLVQVKSDDGVITHFELDSLPKDDASGIRCVHDLPGFFGRLDGGVWMAIRGNSDHPLSKYLRLLSFEPFWRLCEAFGAVLGKQPIVALAKHDAELQSIDAEFAATYLRTQGFEDARSELTVLEYGSSRERGRAIVNWLDTLGSPQAILFTGVNPMVMAVTLAPLGWLASVVDKETGLSVDRPLIDVLGAQQADVDAGADDSLRRGAQVEALIWEPRRVRREALPARPVQSAVQPQLRVLPAESAQAQALPVDKGVVKSQKVLMDALTVRPYTLPQASMKAAVNKVRHLDFDEAIDELGRQLDALQFRILITRARTIANSDAQGSQHLATLYLLYGADPGDRAQELFDLLPDRVPPSLRDYATAIYTNTVKWSPQFRGQVLKKLGL